MLFGGQFRQITFFLDCHFGQFCKWQSKKFPIAAEGDRTLLHNPNGDSKKYCSAAQAAKDSFEQSGFKD